MGSAHSILVATGPGNLKTGQLKWPRATLGAGRTGSRGRHSAQLAAGSQFSHFLISFFLSLKETEAAGLPPLLPGRKEKEDALSSQVEATGPESETQRGRALRLSGCGGPLDAISVPAMVHWSREVQTHPLQSRLFQLTK